MDFNVGPWTEEVLGKWMTTEEFRNDPGAQDAVAWYKMGALLRVYGADDVASIWFSGQPRDGNTGVDATGTSVPEYVRRVVSHMGTL